MTASRAAGQQPPPTWLEWGARAVSLGLVGLLVLFVVADGLRSTTPPSFRYEVDRDAIVLRGDDWAVPATVRNAGSESVSAVGVTMELVTPDGSIAAEETVTVELIGRGSETDLEFLFDTDPRPYEIALAVDGYQLP